jgi:hypothetical protein
VGKHTQAAQRPQRPRMALSLVLRAHLAKCHLADVTAGRFLGMMISTHGAAADDVHTNPQARRLYVPGSTPCTRQAQPMPSGALCQGIATVAAAPRAQTVP